MSTKIQIESEYMATEEKRRKLCHSMVLPLQMHISYMKKMLRETPTRTSTGGCEWGTKQFAEWGMEGEEKNPYSLYTGGLWARLVEKSQPSELKQEVFLQVQELVNTARTLIIERGRKGREYLETGMLFLPFPRS
jgi:hypothetical protein